MSTASHRTARPLAGIPSRSGLSRADDQPHRDEIVARDHVLLLGVNVGQRTDEPAEDGDDGVNAGDGAHRVPVPHDVGGHVLAGEVWLVPVEDGGNELADGCDALVHCGCLVQCLDRGRGGLAIESLKPVVRDPGGMLPGWS